MTDLWSEPALVIEIKLLKHLSRFNVIGAHIDDHVDIPSSRMPSPKNRDTNRSLSATASARPGKREPCTKRAHAPRRARFRLIAAISPSVADGVRSSSRFKLTLRLRSGISNFQDPS